MSELLIHTDEEKREIQELTEVLVKDIEGGVLSDAYRYINERILNAIAEGKITRDSLGFSPVIVDMQTAVLVGHEIGFQNEIITSILLNRCVNEEVFQTIQACNELAPLHNPGGIMGIEDKIKSIEEEIQKTPYNKATSHHIGKLKAKLSRLKEESLQREIKTLFG